VQSSERRTNGQTGETRLGNGTVDDPLLAEAIKQALGHLVPADRISLGPTLCPASPAKSMLALLLRLIRGFAYPICPESEV
jgi:hypothetical protein